VSLDFRVTIVWAKNFAEGNINFGCWGSIILIIDVAFFNAKLDIFYCRFAVHGLNNGFKIVYYIFLVVIFFILSGDLLSSFAFTVGYLASIFIVFKAAKG